jgi:hypothetical protein
MTTMATIIIGTVPAEAMWLSMMREGILSRVGEGQ